jgi:hypothetical protein
MNKKLDLDLPAAETVAPLLATATPAPYVWEKLQAELGDYRRSPERKRAVRHLSRETFDANDGDDPDDIGAYDGLQKPGSICDTQEKDVDVMYLAEDSDEPYTIDRTFIFKRKDGMFIYVHASGCSCGKMRETLACADDFGRFWNYCLSNSARRRLWAVLKG